VTSVGRGERPVFRCNRLTRNLKCILDSCAKTLVVNSFIHSSGTGASTGQLWQDKLSLRQPHDCFCTLVFVFHRLVRAQHDAAPVVGSKAYMCVFDGCATRKIEPTQWNVGHATFDETCHTFSTRRLMHFWSNVRTHTPAQVDTGTGLAIFSGACAARISDQSP
jgi:hypothetical protein